MILCKTIHPTPWKPVLMTTRNWNCISWSWVPSIMALGGRQDGPLRSKVVHRWILAMKHIGDDWDRFVYVGWVESHGVVDDELTWMYDDIWYLMICFDDLWWFVLMILDVGEFFESVLKKTVLEWRFCLVCCACLAMFPLPPWNQFEYPTSLARLPRLKTWAGLVLEN